MRRLPALLIALSLPLQGCVAWQRLGEVGSPPKMTPTSDPTRDPKWHPVTLPMPRPPPEPATASSLWRPGAHSFFNDPRAAQVGDIITVVVDATDSATLNNGTTATRAGSVVSGAPDLLGLQSAISHALPSGANLSQLISTNGTGSQVGTGNITRNETITLRVAAVVTQVLPNGNLALVGRQEFRVNSELRELVVSGIVRPQDIAADNTVTHDRLAEARISYGGRGELTDVQTARWGQQVLDIASPF
ncbi:MAG TPA: flagellar basal body L-ring protein FlgH [Rhodopila sp.]|jgi:flagellar L-ring protein precursor FlgH|nr:flagellar basal body L-ring protein FlgH [Rhodopila sp.]